MCYFFKNIYSFLSILFFFSVTKNLNIINCEIDENLQNMEFISYLEESSDHDYLNQNQENFYIEPFNQELVHINENNEIVNNKYNVDEFFLKNHEVHEFFVDENNHDNEIKSDLEFSEDINLHDLNSHDNIFKANEYFHFNNEQLPVDHEDKKTNDFSFDEFAENTYKENTYLDKLGNDQSNDVNLIEIIPNIEYKSSSTENENISHEFVYNDEKIIITVDENKKLEFKFENGKFIIQNGNEKYDLSTKTLVDAFGNETITSSPWDIGIKIEKNVSNEHTLSGNQIAGLTTGVGITALVGVGGILSKKKLGTKNFGFFSTAKGAFSQQLNKRGFFNSSKEILANTQITGANEILNAASVIDSMTGNHLNGNPGMNRLIERRRYQALRSI